MNYIDLRTVSEDKDKMRTIVTAAHGSNDYDCIRISDRAYLMSKRVITRIYRKLCKNAKNVRDKLFLMTDCDDTPGEYLVVEILRGKIFTFNYRNLIIEIAANKILNTEVC